MTHEKPQSEGDEYAEHIMYVEVGADFIFDTEPAHRAKSDKAIVAIAAEIAKNPELKSAVKDVLEQYEAMVNPDANWRRVGNIPGISSLGINSVVRVSDEKAFWDKAKKVDDLLDGVEQSLKTDIKITGISSGGDLEGSLTIPYDQLKLALQKSEGKAK